MLGIGVLHFPLEMMLQIFYSCLLFFNYVYLINRICYEEVLIPYLFYLSLFGFMRYSCVYATIYRLYRFASSLLCFVAFYMSFAVGGPMTKTKIDELRDKLILLRKQRDAAVLQKGLAARENNDLRENFAYDYWEMQERNLTSRILEITFEIEGLAKLKS